MLRCFWVLLKPLSHHRALRLECCDLKTTTGISPVSLILYVADMAYRFLVYRCCSGRITTLSDGGGYLIACLDLEVPWNRILTSSF